MQRLFKSISGMHGIEALAYWPADKRGEKQVPPTIQFRFAHPLTQSQVKIAAKSAGLVHSQRPNTSVVRGSGFRIHIAHRKKPFVQIQANKMDGELQHGGKIVEFLYVLPAKQSSFGKLLNRLRAYFR